MKGMRVFVALSALVFTQGSSLASDENARYTVTDLGTLGGSFSDGWGLNDRGQVVGTATISSGKEDHAFLWEDGVMKDLGALPGLSSRSRGINKHGQAVGISSVMNLPPLKAILWEKNGEMVLLGTLPGATLPGGFGSFSIGINDRAQIVGGSRIPNRDIHAVLWEKGTITDLGTVSPDDHFSVARAINNRGQIGGNSGPVNSEPQIPPQRGFRWENGVMTDLGNLGSEFTIVIGMNNRGDVVGESDRADGERHAFLWRRGTMTDLGALGGLYSSGWSVNRHDQVVGTSALAGGQPHAFLWRDGVMSDLNDLIPSNSGWVLTIARSINRSGEIVGSGTINGQTHAFLLTPNDDDE